VPRSVRGCAGLSGPEDRLDALADRREVRSVAGFVVAAEVAAAIRSITTGFRRLTVRP
jgi:hypothetical protein